MQHSAVTYQIYCICWRWCDGVSIISSVSLQFEGYFYGTRGPFWLPMSCALFVFFFRRHNYSCTFYSRLLVNYGFRMEQQQICEVERAKACYGKLAPPIVSFTVKYGPLLSRCSLLR